MTKTLKILVKKKYDKEIDKDQGSYRKLDIKIKDFSRTFQHQIKFFPGPFVFLFIEIVTEHRKTGNAANTVHCGI